MHAQIGRMTSLERAYLNAAFEYHRDKSSEPADAAISKEVFRLLRDGLDELAAVKAGESPVTLEIFSKAADAAEKTEGKWKS